MTESNSEKQQLFHLADVVRLTKISRHTVQYYLLLGLVTETQRTPGGHRLFDNAAVRRIKLIQQLNRSGYTLQEIRQTFFTHSS
jgi:DNA-binding transcriptional MerR regulator